jgi:hypothetical protein
VQTLPLQLKQQPKENPCLRQDDEKGGADRPRKDENNEVESKRFDDDDDDAQLQLEEAMPADKVKLESSREKFQFGWQDFPVSRESGLASW